MAPARRSVAGACFIGMFCAFLPVPAQMLVAGVIAVIARCNLPISVALVWLTNPITVPPLFYFAYKLGAWLLGQELEVTQIDLSFDWLADRFGEIWQPFLLGCVVCGWVSGVTLYVLVHLVWRLEVGRRWHKRRKKRAPVRRRWQRRGGRDIAARKPRRHQRHSVGMEGLRRVERGRAARGHGG